MANIVKPGGTHKNQLKDSNINVRIYSRGRESGVFCWNVEHLSGQQFIVSVIIFSEKDTLISEERKTNLLSPHLYAKY